MKIIIITILIIATLFIPWHAYCQEMELSAEPEPEAVDSVSISTDEAKLPPDTQALENDTLEINADKEILELAKQDAEKHTEYSWMYIMAGVLSTLPAYIYVFSKGISEESFNRFFTTGAIMMALQLPAALALGNLASALTDRPDRDLSGYTDKQKQQYEDRYRMLLAANRSFEILLGYITPAGTYAMMMVLVAVAIFLIWVYLFLLFWVIAFLLAYQEGS